MMPPGFVIHRGAVSLPSDIAALASTLTWTQPTIRLYGRECKIPRLTAWLGTGPYTYSGVRHDPAPMPEWLAEVSSLVADLAGVLFFNSVLCNLYRDGSDSVSWHADDEPELGEFPVIASVSLGAARSFHVKPRDPGDKQRWKLQLAHGDVLVMSGRSQLDYLHSVPKTSKPVGPRINLTFRSVHS